MKKQEQHSNDKEQHSIKRIKHKEQQARETASRYFINYQGSTIATKKTKQKQRNRKKTAETIREQGVVAIAEEEC